MAKYLFSLFLASLFIYSKSFDYDEEGGPIFGDDDSLDVFRIEGVFNGFGAGSSAWFLMVHLCNEFHPGWVEINDCPLRFNTLKSVIRNYGCNCWPKNQDQGPVHPDAFTSFHMGKNGRPLDDFDKACQLLHDAYHCLEIDAFNGVYPHPPPELNSTPDMPLNKCSRFTFFAYHSDTNNQPACGPIDNPDYLIFENSTYNADTQICRVKACEIEKQFALNAFAAIKDTWSDTFRVDNDAIYRAWEDEEKGLTPIRCIKQQLGNTADSCCGEMPERYPYVTSVSECCPNNELHYIGDC